MKYEASSNSSSAQFLVEDLEGYFEWNPAAGAVGELEFSSLDKDGFHWGRAKFRNGRLESLIFVNPAFTHAGGSEICWYKLRNIPEYGLRCATYLDSDRGSTELLADFEPPNECVLQQIITCLAQENFSGIEPVEPLNDVVGEWYEVSSERRSRVSTFLSRVRGILG